MLKCDNQWSIFQKQVQPRIFYCEQLLPPGAKTLNVQTSAIRHIGHTTPHKGRVAKNNLRVLLLLRLVLCLISCSVVVSADTWVLLWVQGPSVCAIRPAAGVNPERGSQETSPNHPRPQDPSSRPGSCSHPCGSVILLSRTIDWAGDLAQERQFIVHCSMVFTGV